jgi:hypothetical protein
MSTGGDEALAPLGRGRASPAGGKEGYSSFGICRLCVNHPPNSFGGIHEGSGFFSSVRLSIPSMARSFNDPIRQSFNSYLAFRCFGD